jgi:DNA-binding NtrC family response regulator
VEASDAGKQIDIAEDGDSRYSRMEALTMQVASRTNLRQMLFVDDEPGIRLTLPPILEEYGFQIRIADSVPSALKEISLYQFDVLLSDLNIAQAHDGFSVVKAARAANPACVAILLTGYPDFDSAVEGIDSEIDGYLVKPADIEKLVKTIEQKLAARIRA